MRIFRWLLPSVAALALTAVGTNTLRAQATTGSITGQVTDPSGAAVEGAQIQVVSPSTGSRTGAVARESGRYIVQGLQTGPGYTVTVRRIGFAPQTRENIAVTLGQATRLDFQLAAQATVLAAVTVSAQREDAIISPTKTGVGTTIGDSALRRLPSLNRNFTDFVRLTPQVQSAPNNNNAVSAGGAPARLNRIQIDGANSTDVFGLASTGGAPGAQANGRAINLEAVKEYQVLLSPFDVRQGNFAGALINAVTKNGTNEFHGTGVLTTRNQNLGRDTPILRATRFQQDQYDFSLGGPIVKDKAFFFLAPSIQNQQSPASGPYLGQASNSQVAFVPNADTITKFQNILRDKYGIDAGNAGAVSNDNPLRGLFSRLDFNLPGLSSRLVLHNNYQDNRRDVFSRTTAQANPTVALSANAYQFRNKINQSVAQFYTNWASGANNELIASYNQTRDRRVPNLRSPQITVNVRNGAAIQYSLLTGADASSQANELDQDITSVTDNYTRPFGAHTVTVGTQNELFKIRNLFAQNLSGTYVFYNLDSLNLGRPLNYTGAVSQGAKIAAQFKASNYSAYVQDAWTVTPRLNLTYGVRADIPVINSKPFYNQQIDSIFGQSTNEVPSGNVLYSPRVGFNWDVTGNQQNQLRGGVGAFAGTPSFVFISNAFGNTGAGATQLQCLGSANAPNFVADPSAQPNVCQGGGSFRAYNQGGPLGAIATIDPDFKYPQSFRSSLGFDHAVSPTLTLTLEGLYTRAISAPFYLNDNLGAAVGTVGSFKGAPLGTDRFGRVIYGNIATTGTATPTLVTTRIPATGTSGLIRLTNQNLDYSYSYTSQLNKRFSNGASITGSYTYGHSYDVQSLTSDVASSNFRFGRTIGTRAQTEKYLGRSIFDAPHRVLIDGSYTVKPTKTDLTVIYDGHSGSPYDYVYGSGSGNNSGDLNADGYQGNDLIYVPNDLNDVNQVRFVSRVRGTGADSAQDVVAQKGAFSRLIQSTPCLKESQGRIMDRNACRNPWQNDMQVSVRQSLPQFRGNNLSLQLDVFNFLNMLNKNWGQQSFAGGNSQVNLLTHQGQSAATLLGESGSVPIVQYGSAANPIPLKYTSANVASNYRIQLGARYAF